MRSLFALSMTVLLGSLSALSFAGDWVKWNGNGHSYMAVLAPNGILWNEANLQAQQLGGHLATLTSAEENAFVFSLIDKPEFWINQNNGPVACFGPWFGLVQDNNPAAVDSDWHWLTGETFAYSNWNVGEPNKITDQITEHWAHYHAIGFDNRSSTWNNLDQYWYYLPNIAPRGFVVEMSEPSVPGPAAALPMVLGLTAGILRRRKIR